MVSTRSNTGEPQNVPGSETKVSALSSTIEPPTDVKEPEKKCHRIFEGESNLPPRKPDDGTLEALPMDVVLEILSYLHPLDLLQLARTSRIFCNWLMSKHSCHILRAARSALGIDVPECPPDQSEPQWARLIFNLTCPLCNATDETKVEWGLRVRGCRACLEEILIFGSEVPKAFPGVEDVNYILDLLPFAYQGPRNLQSQQEPPLSTEQATRRYYRPEIQPMIDLYQSHRNDVLAEVPGAEAQFDTLVAERKQIVLAILSAEEQQKSWEGAQAKLRDRKRWEETLRWRAIYQKELISLGYHRDVAYRASSRKSKTVRLEDGWEKNRAFFEDAASRMRYHRMVQERSSEFHVLYQSFVSHTDKRPPFRGMWPSSRDLEADSKIKEILESGDGEAYQDELRDTLPAALDRWWELRKETLVGKIFDIKRQQSPAGPALQAILELAKSVFTFNYPDLPMNCLENYPIYCERSLTNHQRPETRPYRVAYASDASKMEFDALSSSQVDAVCAALGLEANRATFTELDELDARFRCVNCPCKRKIMNWRTAIKHRHSQGEASQCVPPTFTKISDEEAVIVRAFELDHPDRSFPIGRIRSPQCDRAFYTTSELLDYLNESHGQTELAPYSYWVDPSLPPKPVLETDVFKG